MSYSSVTSQDITYDLPKSTGTYLSLDKRVYISMGTTRTSESVRTRTTKVDYVESLLLSSSNSYLI